MGKAGCKSDDPKAPSSARLEGRTSPSRATRNGYSSPRIWPVATLTKFRNTTRAMLIAIQHPLPVIFRVRYISPYPRNWNPQRSDYPTTDHILVIPSFPTPILVAHYVRAHSPRPNPSHAQLVLGRLSSRVSALFKKGVILLRDSWNMAPPLNRRRYDRSLNDVVSIPRYSFSTIEAETAEEIRYALRNWHWGRKP